MGLFDDIKLSPERKGNGESATPLGQIELLLRQAGLTFGEMNSGQGFKMSFDLANDRSQLVLVEDGGAIGDVQLVLISSAIADLAGSVGLPPTAAIKLLQAAAQLKVGGFSLMGEALVFGCAVPLASLEPTALRALAIVVAKTADDPEKRMTGQDRF